MSSKPNPLLIGDLVDVPYVRTVIRLGDMDDPELRGALLHSFVITGEVAQNLNMVLGAISAGRSRCAFLTGHYGCGKSHFLSMLGLLLEGTNQELRQAAWAHLVSQEPRLEILREKIGPRKIITCPVPLLASEGREPLAQIVLSAMVAATARVTGSACARISAGRFVDDLQALLKVKYPEAAENHAARLGLTSASALFSTEHITDLEDLARDLGIGLRPFYQREEVIAEITATLAQGGVDGMLLLADELSEFLRSKRDRRDFNEDVRFLQYLGEAADRIPLWVVAALQEGIERTGEISPATLNKIKDRYALRLRLSAEHIEDLCSLRLLQKKAGAKEALPELYRRFSRSFGGWKVTLERFERLYPVHPAVIDYLDASKDLFSQHRGAVDFLAARLRGDPDRDIPGKLDNPHDQLLTPDTLYDHFRDRIAETPETSRYVDVAETYLNKVIEERLENTDQKVLAARAIKLLVLSAISPVPEALTVGRLAEMLLSPVSQHLEEANYAFVRDTLHQLSGAGAYLTHESADDLRLERFYLQLEIDSTLAASRMIEDRARDLFPDDRRIFKYLAPLVDSAQLPLASLLVPPRQRTVVPWGTGNRTCLLVLSPLHEVSRNEIAAAIAALEAADIDLALFTGTPLACEQQQGHLYKELLEEASHHLPAGAALVFWLPDSFKSEESRLLRHVLAAELLAEEYRQSDQAFGAHARSYGENHKSEITAAFIRSYHAGKIYLLDHEPLEVSKLEAPSHERFLRELAAIVLKNRYPKHLSLQPHFHTVLPDTISDALNAFIRPGTISTRAPLSQSVRSLIERFLVPMQLARKARGTYQLNADPRSSPLAATAMAYLHKCQGLVPRDALEIHLKTGPYGLTGIQVGFLIQALIFSGQVTAYSGSRRLDPAKLSTDNLNLVDAIGPGELLDAEDRERLKHTVLISKQARSATLTFPQQEEIWSRLLEKGQQKNQELEVIRSRLASARAFKDLNHLDLARARQDLHSAETLLAALNPTFSSREGLRLFINSAESCPMPEAMFDRLQRLYEFLREGLETYINAVAYVEHPAMNLEPGGSEEELRHQREALRALLMDPAGYLRDDYLEVLRGRLERFKEQYTARYLTAHCRQRDGERFKSLAKLRESRGYKLLSRLKRLEWIEVANHHSRIDRQIEDGLKERCLEPEPGLLARSPVCTCGFKLADQVCIPEAAEVEGHITEGIGEYLQALASPAIGRRLEEQRALLEKTGDRASVAVLDEFLGLEKNGPMAIINFDAFFDEQAEGILTRAVKGGLKQLNRDLNTFTEALAGRHLPIHRVREIFEQWLDLSDEPRSEIILSFTQYRTGPKGDRE